MKRGGHGWARCQWVVTGGNEREQDVAGRDGGSRRQVTGSRQPQQGLHPPEQLNSLFWTSATLRPRRLAGPEH